VLFIITKSNYGGAQRYVHDLACNLNRDKYEVAVAFGGTGTKGAPTGSLYTKLKQVGIRTIAIQHFMRNVSIVDDVRAFIELTRLCYREHPDTLHVTSSKAGGLGALAGRIAGIQTIVFTSHGLTFDESWRPWWQRQLIKLFTWGTILLATTTIQINKHTFERARRLPWCREKVRLIYNGIDKPVFKDRQVARTELAERAGIDAHDTLPWIVTIAELHPNKNLDALVASLHELHARDVAVRMFILGDGELREELERQTTQGVGADHIHILGYVPDAATYLQAADMFVLPSYKEGLPYVLLEAGWAQLPVIVSNIPGNADVVEYGKTGYVVNPTPQQLTEAIAHYLTTHDEATTHAKALHARVASTFSLERMVRDTSHLYT